MMPTMFTMYAIAGIVTLGILIYLALARRKAKPYYGQTMDTPRPRSKPELVVDNGPLDDTDKPEPYISPGGRVAFICFLSVWQIFWTFAVYHAILEWWALSYGDENYIFMMFWLSIAVPGWFFVAYTLIRLFRGDHFEIHFDGDD